MPPLQGKREELYPATVRSQRTGATAEVECLNSVDETHDCFRRRRRDEASEAGVLEGSRGLPVGLAVELASRGRTLRPRPPRSPGELPARGGCAALRKL